MEQISSRKFGLLIAQLRATFTRNEMTPEQVSVYYAYLKNTPEIDLTQAVQRIIETKVSPIFPTIAEIKLIAEKKSKDEIKLDAMEAWGKAERYLISGNREDLVLNEIIRVAFGGWKGFGMTDPENDFDRHRFMEAYQIIMSDADKMENIKRLDKAREPLTLLDEGKS